ncbi:MAG: HNH endonuclease [Clostridiales bacterium]|jgi:hypothetical protein|nr:HNH endonuclease [Clostridiales bacterium]
MINAITYLKDEEFKPVMINGEEYHNYLISNFGRVYSIKSDKFLSGYKDNQGYVNYILYKDGQPKHAKAHRLVGFGYVDNPESYNIINHKDEQPDNNSYLNLEWCTQAYNLNYGNAQERRAEKIRKPVIQVDAEFNIVAEYPSLLETSKQTGICVSQIYEACTYGVQKRDYIFAYTEKRAC